MPWPGACIASDKRPALETTAITIVDRKSMLDGGTNCGKGEQLWQLYMVRGDHWWRRVWSGPTTCGVDNLRRDRSRDILLQKEE